MDTSNVSECGAMCYEAMLSNVSDVGLNFDDLLREGQIRYKDAPTIIILCLYSIVFITAVVGNVLVMVVILGLPRMRRSPTNYFLLNMAISDLMVALICIPVAMTRNAYRSWILGEVMCRFTPFVQGVAVASGVFTITALSLDRFLAIKYPMLFRRRNPSVFVKISLFLVWVFAALLMVPIGTVKRVTSISGVNISVRYCTEAWSSSTARHSYAVLLLVCIYVIPGLVMTTLYVIMGRRLWTSGHDVARHGSSASNQSSTTSGRRRVAQMSVVVAVLFAACWLPYYAFSTMLDFNPDRNIPMNALYFALLLGHANCSINPVLYCFIGRTFRRSMLSYFYACFKCSRVEHNQGQSRRLNTTTFNRSHYDAASQANGDLLNGSPKSGNDQIAIQMTFTCDRDPTQPQRPSSIRSADSAHGTIRKTVVFASRSGHNI